MAKGVLPDDGAELARRARIARGEDEPDAGPTLERLPAVGTLVAVSGVLTVAASFAVGPSALRQRRSRHVLPQRE